MKYSLVIAIFLGMIISEEEVSAHKLNVRDSYSAWRSAFRESVKLTLNGDKESLERLEAWLHPVSDADFRHDAKRGAEEGSSYAKENKDNQDALNMINNFDWLREKFNDKC